MRLLGAALALLASIALVSAQTRQPASITVQPTVTPEPVQVLDAQGNWNTLGTMSGGAFSPPDRTLPLTSFGAKCDGVTDDWPAFQKAIAAWGDGVTLVIPGDCRTSQFLVFPPANYASVLGRGLASKITYTGTNTNGDIVTFGNYNSPCSMMHFTMQNMQVQSMTLMTGGNGARFNTVCTGTITNVNFSDQFGGNYNLWNGAEYAGGNTVVVPKVGVAFEA